MTEITGLSTTDSSNTLVTGESIDGAIANMGRMDNTLQAILGLLARSIRTNVLRFLDNTDDTKRVALDLSGLPTATTRTWTAPYYSGTLGLVSDIRGQIYGLTLLNNGSDPTNDIDIAAGAAVDSTGAVSMLLASSLTKRLDAAWAVGTGQGGLDTGAIANVTYHVYLMRRPDTGVVDSCFSISPVAPTTGGAIPSAYTQFRRIGSILRESGTIVPFLQVGDYFFRPSFTNFSAPLGRAYALLNLSVPTGIIVRPLFTVRNYQATIGQTRQVVGWGPTEATQSFVVAESILANTTGAANVSSVFSDIQGRVWQATNVVSGTVSDNTVITNGWIDTRGA